MPLSSSSPIRVCQKAICTIKGNKARKQMTVDQASMVAAVIRVHLVSIKESIAHCASKTLYILKIQSKAQTELSFSWGWRSNERRHGNTTEIYCVLEKGKCYEEKKGVWIRMLDLRRRTWGLWFIMYLRAQEEVASQKKIGKKRKKKVLCGFLEEVLPWNWDQPGLFETAKTNHPV